MVQIGIYFSRSINYTTCRTVLSLYFNLRVFSVVYSTGTILEVAW